MTANRFTTVLAPTNDSDSAASEINNHLAQQNAEGWRLIAVVDFPSDLVANELPYCTFGFFWEDGA